MGALSQIQNASPSEKEAKKMDYNLQIHIVSHSFGWFAGWNCEECFPRFDCEPGPPGGGSAALNLLLQGFATVWESDDDEEEEVRSRGAGQRPGRALAWAGPWWWLAVFIAQGN